MSLPITAVGPLKVLTKPILTFFSWASAGQVASANAVAAKTPILIIVFFPSDCRALRRGDVWCC